MDTDRGRRAVGGKIEVRVRIRDPLSEKDVHIDKWKWLVIDLHLSSKKVRRSCDNRIVVTHSLPHALRLASQQRAGGTGASQKETRPLINSPQFFMPLPYASGLEIHARECVPTKRNTDTNGALQ